MGRRRIKFEVPKGLGEEVLTASENDGALPEMVSIDRKGHDAIKLTGESWELSESLGLMIIERIEQGFTLVQNIGWLIKDHGLSITMAQEVIDFALKHTVGKMDHAQWTDMYRMMLQDLYRTAKEKGKLSIANSIMNNMVKLQYLSQSKALRENEHDLQEKKFQHEVVVRSEELQERERSMEIEVKKGKDSTQGFRLQIESFTSTQTTTPKEIVDIPKVLPPSET